MTNEGDAIPDLTLEGSLGEEVRSFTLSDLAADRPTVLVFYVYDFSPVCTRQVCEVDDTEFLTFNDDVAVVGLSTDGPYSHRQFIAETGITYPLLTDDDKLLHEACGMLAEGEDGRSVPKRGIVLLDRDRQIRYRWQAEDNWDDWEITPLDEVYEVVQDLVG